MAADSAVPRHPHPGDARRRAREVLRRRIDTGRSTRPGTDGVPRRHLIVCGDDPLAHRLVEELVHRYRVRVTVLLASRRRGHGPQIARLPDVRVIEASQLDSTTFRRAGIASAAALALVHQDDVGNINAALQVQELNPKLRLVIRMFNMSLGNGVRQLFPDCRVLSDAAMAAPAFVSAALGEVAPVHVRLSGRTLHVAPRTEVADADIVCGLAVTGVDHQPDLLPSDQSRANLVLAVATGLKSRTAIVDQSADTRGTPALSLAHRHVPRWRRVAASPRLRRLRRRPFGALSMLISRKLRVAAVVLFGLLVAGTFVLKLTERVGWLDAGYRAILDTLAGANPDPTAPPVVKATETALTIVSIALIPIVTAAVVEAAVNARLALALGRLREPISDHVVVVGLGNVGTRVIRRLHDLGVPIVAVDRKDDARGIPVARDLGIPYIIGEANRAETLRAASVRTCRALVVVSTDDVTNLETTLQGRAIKDDLRVVLRLFDGEFASRVQRAFGITISRSVSFLAAPAFAAAMLEREVIGTIPVDRRVLLIAEIPVCAGSELAGVTLADAAHVGEARVIGLMVDRRQHTLWEPAPQRCLEVDDVLLVVATRVGLGRLLARSGSAGEGVSAEVTA